VSAPDPNALVAALRRPRHVALLVLAVCALATGVLTLSEPMTGPVDQRYTLAALALAAASIFTRRSVPGADPARLVALQRASCAAAALLGPLGLALAVREHQASVGLLYCVAGALLLLRPAPRFLAPRAAPPRRD
jgi:uncharacterized membrane protein